MHQRVKTYRKLLLMLSVDIVPDRTMSSFHSAQAILRPGYSHMTAHLTANGGFVRISLCTITVLLFVAAPALSPQPQQSANGNPQKTAFVDPCANAATDADKKACWTEAAARTFSSTPTPAKPAQIKVTKNATTAKWIAPNRPPPVSTPTTAQSKKPCAPI
jgi:hypothetical protein